MRNVIWLRRSQLRSLVPLCALVTAVASIMASGDARAYDLTGTVLGTFNAGTVDTFGYFGSAGANLSGETFSATISYNTSGGSLVASQDSGSEVFHTDQGPAPEAMSVVTVGGVTLTTVTDFRSSIAYYAPNGGNNVGIDTVGYTTPNEVDFYMDSTTPFVTDILNTQAGFNSVLNGLIGVGNGTDVINMSAVDGSNLDQFHITVTGTQLPSVQSTLPITAGPAVSTANLGTTVAPDFEGGTLAVAANGTISANFNVGAVAGNTIDAQGYSATFSGTFTGTGGLTFTDSLGGGATTLSNPGGNTYSGTTTVSAGMLQAGANNAFSPDSAVVMANVSSAVLNLAGYNETIAGLSGGGASGGNVHLGAGALTINGGGLYAGVISGSGSLVNASGKLILTASNAYTGGTTISGGTLQLGNGSTTGSIVGNVADNGTLAFDWSNTQVFSGVIGGSGSVSQAGTGTTVLTATNTFTGGTTIASGTLQLGNGGTTGTIAGNVTDNGKLVFDLTGNTSYSGVISGTGSLTQAGSGTLLLNGVNTATGATNVNAGILEVGDASHSGAVLNSSVGGVSVGAAGTLSGHGTVVGAVANAGKVAPGGTIGTLTVGSFNQSSSGTLQIEVSPAAASQLVVTGAAGLNGTFLAQFDSGTYSTALYPVLSSSAITGEFSVVSQTGAPTGFVDGLYYNPAHTQVDLALEATRSAALYGDMATAAIDDAHSFATLLLARGDNCGFRNSTTNDGGRTCEQNVWIQGVGQSGSTSSHGFDTSSGGVMGGVDFRLPAGALLGIAGGYSNDHLNASWIDSSATINNYDIGAYGELPLSGAARLDVGAFYYAADGNAHRDTGGAGIANSSPNAHGAGVAVQASYDLMGGDLTPLADLRYVGYSGSQTTETAAIQPLGFAVSGISKDSLRAELGVRLAHDYISGTTLIRPMFQVGLEQELGSVARPVDGQLPLVAGTAFTTYAFQPSRTAGRIAAGLTADITDRVDVFINANARFSGNQTDGSVVAGGTLHF